MRYRFQLRFDADAGIPDRQIEPLPFERPYDDGHPNRSGEGDWASGRVP